MTKNGSVHEHSMGWCLVMLEIYGYWGRGWGGKDAERGPWSDASI